MERNIDFRAATISAGNGLTRRRQRVTTLKDSTEVDRVMELPETVRLRDRERLQKKDRDREFSKRRKVESYVVQQRNGGGGESYRENDSSDASDEEYREEEDDARFHYLNRMNQPSPPSSSFSNNRRSLRSLRSSPMLRTAVDEMIGVPIPRRARSSSTKRSHEYCNSGSGRLGEDLSRRIFLPSPATATASLVNAGGASSSSSGAFLKKKMKSVEPRTSALNSSSNSRPPSVIQDDIEIEVVEALFDLMKQSQSLSQSSKRQEKLDKNDKNTADEGLTKRGKDDSHIISVRNKHSIKVDTETNTVDSMEEFKNEERIEIEKFPDDSAMESADGFLDKEKVVTPKESVSQSSVKVNAGEIQDPTVTKANYAAIVVETKKEAKFEIDLMAPPPLPSSPEKDVSVDLSSPPKFMAQDLQKKSETISKDGPLAVTIRPKEEERGAISSNQSPNLNLEKHHPDDSSVRDGSKQKQWGPKEQKNQLQTSFLPFPISMSGWPGALPHPGYMPHVQAVLPMDGSRFPTAIQPPKFKLSQPRPKRSVTHQYIACNIRYHQQLITKSLWSGPTGAATFYGTKPVNPNSIPPTQRLNPGNPLLGDYQGRQNCSTISGGSGKDKDSEVPAALNATKSKDLAVQQAPLQSSTNNFLHGPAFVFPLDNHQTTVTLPAKPTEQPQSASAVGSLSLPSNPAGGPSVHLSVPGEAAAMSFNNPKLPSNEVAPYMAVLQNKNSQFPLSMNIAMPQLKGGTQGPTMPLFNSSFYSSPMFSVSQSQQLLSLPHAPALSGTKIGDNNFPTIATVNSQQAEKQQVPPSLLSSKYDIEIGRLGSTPLADGLSPHSVKPNNGQTCSFPVQPMNFAIIPPGSIGAAAAVGNKHGDIQQLGSKGRAELIPQAFALSFGSNPSTGPALNYSSMAQNSAIFQILPDMAWNGYQMAQQKSFQTSERKIAVGSTKMDDGLKGILGKSQTSGGQSSKSGSSDISALSMMGTSMVDGLARAVNVGPSSSSANQQPFPSSSVAQTSGVSVILPNLHHHQQQAIQLQKLHMQQMQLTGTAQFKASTANGMSGSFLPSSFPSNQPIFSHVSVQNDNSSYSSHCQSLPRTTAPEESPQFANSNVVNIPQGRRSQGHTHISFGSSLVSAASFQGQQVVTNNQPALAVGLSPNSSLSKITGSSQRTASHISNAGSTISALSSQQTEASQNGPSQKSSPACGRNVPSILSTCPSHLSELKY